MKTGFAAAVSAGLALTAGATAAQAAGPVVHLDRLVARVIIIPEARTNISAEVRNGGKGGLAKPTLSLSGQDLSVTGGLTRMELNNCRVRRGGHGVNFGFFRHIDEADLPVVTVHTPMDVTIEADSAVEVETAGTLHALTVKEKGCGAWKIGDVSERLTLAFDGLGDVSAGSIGATSVKLNGMGDVNVRTTGALDVVMDGVGHVIVDQVNGPVSASLQGMGDLRIKGGHATTFLATLDGIGGIRFGGVADSVDATSDGMGSIHVAKATGAVRKRQNGIGVIKVGD